MQIGYKKLLYKDWKSGRFTVTQLAEKYDCTIFKVNLIIEKEADKDGKRTR